MAYRCGVICGADGPEMLRDVDEIDPAWAAEKYVESYHSELDYPTEVRVQVRHHSGDVRSYRVVVEACPVATATRID